MAKVVWNKNSVGHLIKDLADKLETVGQNLEKWAVLKITEMEIVDTGRYRNSITHATDKENLSTKVGTNVEYAPYLELGTIKMPPRPALRMALYENEKEIMEILTK